MKRGFTCGSYDLFHAGHVLALKEARENCDYLIVGLQTDPTIDRPHKNKPVQSVEERRIQLQGCRYIDEVWEYTTEAELYSFLADKNSKIDVRFLGQDWEGKSFTGCELDVRCVFTSRGHSFSSSELRKRIADAEIASLAEAGQEVVRACL